MRISLRILFLLAAAAMLASCAGDQPTDPVPATVGPDKADTVINDYVVRYVGRTVENSGGEVTTTFEYLVFGRGVVAGIDVFALTLPECLPPLVAWFPEDDVIYDPADPGEIAWTVPIEPYAPAGQRFAITYDGDVPEGAIMGTVGIGDAFQSNAVPGPACPEFEVAAAVFIDADAEGDRDPDELGIANVAVELVNPDGSVDVLVTDDDGNVSALVGEGTYTLRVDLEAYPENFNAELAESFDATTPLEIVITVGPGATENLFGFAPRTEQLIEQLESGDLPSNGWPAKFWRQQIGWAIEEEAHPEAEFTREELLAFLAEVQTLYLEEIFQFTPGNELEEAFDVLQRITQTPEDHLTLTRSLSRQLLAAELNEVAGRGLGDENAALQETLIAWGEAVWVENLDAGTITGPAPGPDEVRGLPEYWTAASEFLRPAISIFTLINTGGGGGVDEKR